METIKKLFWISRPISWPNTAYPFAVGYIVMAGQLTPGISLATFIIGTLYFIAPYNLLMYGINDIFDYESDIKNPRKGGVEGMREERAFHPTLFKAIISITLPFFLALLILSNWPGRIVLLLVVGAAIAYSVKGLRFKEIPVLDSLTSSFHFVGPLLYAVVLVGFTPATLPWLSAFFLWGIASHAFGAVQDIKPDRQAGIHSIATVFGARTTTILSFVLYALAAGIVAYQGIEYLPIALAGLAYCANIAPFLGVSDTTSEKTNAGWKRFLWLNYATGAVVTMVILVHLIG